MNDNTDRALQHLREALNAQSCRVGSRYLVARASRCFPDRHGCIVMYRLVFNPRPSNPCFSLGLFCRLHAIIIRSRYFHQAPSTACPIVCLRADRLLTPRPSVPFDTARGLRDHPRPRARVAAVTERPWAWRRSWRTVTENEFGNRTGGRSVRLDSAEARGDSRTADLDKSRRRPPSSLREIADTLEHRTSTDPVAVLHPATLRGSTYSPPL